MSILSDIKAGIETRLNTLSNLRVYRQPPDSVNAFPAAVVMTDSVQHSLTFAGTAMSGAHRVVMFTESAVTEQAIRNLDARLHPGNADSFLRALYGDKTLSGNVDGVTGVSVENIGVRVLPDGDPVVGADFVVRWVRS